MIEALEPIRSDKRLLFLCLARLQPNVDADGNGIVKHQGRDVITGVAFNTKASDGEKLSAVMPNFGTGAVEAT